MNKIINSILSTIMICKPKKKKSMIKELISNPDNFRFEIYTEDEEITIKIKRRES